MMKTAGHLYVYTGTPDTYRGKGPYVLTVQSERIDPADIVQSGYPFFAGEMTLKSELIHQNGDPTQLRLSGNFAVCHVSVNGNPVKSNIFTREFDLEPYIRDGGNDLEFRVCFSNRNLLGPHHCVDPEPMVVSPSALSFENAWNGDHCDSFVHDLAFVKHGISF